MRIRSHPYTRAGFTIVETIIGIMLFGVTFISLYGAMAQSLSSLHMSREHLRATQIMVEKLEVLRLYNWQRLNDPAYLRRTFKVSYTPLPAGGLPGSSPEGTTYFGSIIISDPPISANYKSNMKLVTVRVTWKTGSIDRARSMSTLVAFDGLHTYVY